MKALKKITACAAALSLITASFSAAAYNDVLMTIFGLFLGSGRLSIW